jgi:RNA polymerase sigma-70 factor (ECF subfamily)
MSVGIRQSATAVATAGPAPATPAELDEALIQEVARGNQLALRTLYNRHQVHVFRFILRIVRDRGQAEDALSEAFFDVWRRAGAYERRSSVSTWILGIARHKALTAVQARRFEPLDEVMARGIADPANNAEALMREKDRAATVRRCLAALSPEHSEIIDLVYYQEKSIKEIADSVGIPLNTVKTRMFHARRRLAALVATEIAEQDRA